MWIIIEYISLLEQIRGRWLARVGLKRYTPTPSESPGTHDSRRWVSRFRDQHPRTRVPVQAHTRTHRSSVSFLSRFLVLSEGEGKRVRRRQRVRRNKVESGCSDIFQKSSSVITRPGKDPGAKAYNVALFSRFSSAPGKQYP